MGSVWTHVLAIIQIVWLGGLSEYTIVENFYIVYSTYN